MREFTKRTLQEVALRKDEASFQVLVLRSPVPHVLYDTQGVILLVNDRLTAIFGYTREDVPRLERFWQLAFPNPEARVAAQTRWFAAVSKAGHLGRSDITPDEYLVTCKDGTVRLVEVFGTLVGDSALMAFCDVTARRLAEAVLEDHRIRLEKLVDERTRELNARQDRQKSGVYIDITERKAEERRLQMAMRALETTRECVYWIDVDGRMLYVNPATERELGRSAEELLQMKISDIDPDTPAELWGPEGELTRRLKVEGLRKFATHHRHRDGHLIPVEVDSDPFHYDGQIFYVAIARDISARLAAEETLRKSEAKFVALFNLTPEPMALTRLDDGVVIEVSRSYAEYFGYHPEEIVGRTTLPGDLGFWIDAEQRHQWVERLKRDGEVLAFETPMRRRDGSIMTALISGKAVDMAGEQCVIVDIHDITEQKQHADKLEKIAHRDALTGLPNRVLLDDRMRQAMAQNQRAGTYLAVCYIDLDGFKQVNDRLGHQAGDQLLIEVAKRLTARARGGDTIARLGGDEFVALLSGLADDDECRLALDRLLQAVSAPYTIDDGKQAVISASVGVTLFPNDPADPGTLVRHADHAMYAAKRAGKNRYQMFDSRLEQRIEARHAILQRVAEALSLKQFMLHYQPKVDCRHGRVVGVEAVIRWQHPTLGLLSPAEFVPLIDDTDLAVPVGEWVIRETLSQIALWRREGIDLPVSVNAFARHLLQPGFATALAATLDRSPEAAPGRLQIEIVETAALKERDAIRQVIEDCGRLGVDFALDDFGTGYSSLAYLRHLPVAEIKIDQSFVCHMLTRPEDLAMVEAMIGLGRAFGRSIIAEGAETPAHVSRLLALGCDVMQGYALARPMPASDIAHWVREFRPDPAWYRAADSLGAM